MREGLKPKLKVLPQGHFTSKEQNMVECFNPQNKPYFWIGPPPKRDLEDTSVDVGAVSQGDVVLTPLGLNLTHYPTLKKLEESLK